MCLRAAGILADLDARGISRLMDCLPINPPPVAPEDSAASRDRLCVLHLLADSGARRCLDVMRSADTSFMLREIEDLASAPRPARLRADRFLELVGGMARTTLEPLVAVTELAPWSEPAWSALDLLASP